MFLHRFLLLVMFIGQSNSEPKTNCDRMACFTPIKCINSQSASIKLAIIELSYSIGDSCEAVVKIRSYTSKHVLMVLESYDSTVTSLKLEQGPTAIFECKIDENIAVAYYNSKAIPTNDMIHQNATPLSCEFYVKSDENDVFEFPPTDDVKLYSSKSDSTHFSYHKLMFSGSIEATCDIENVKTIQSSTVSDGKLLRGVDAKLGKLECPIDYKLIIDEKNNNIIVEALSVICIKGINPAGYRYQVTPIGPAPQPILIFDPFIARCEATICTMCDASDVPSVLMKIMEEDCTMFKCKKGLIQMNSFEPMNGYAECNYIGDKFVWQLKGQTINKNTEIKCIEKLTCKTEDAKNLCEECMVNTEDIPKCNGNRKLMFGEDEVEEVKCNDNTGKFEFTIKNKGEYNTEGNKLKCVDVSVEAAQTASVISLTPVAFAFAAIGLLLLGSIVGGLVVFLIFRNKKRTMGGALKENKESKSKEAKSANSLQNVNDRVESNPVRPANDGETLAECPSM